MERAKLRLGAHELYRTALSLELSGHDCHSRVQSLRVGLAHHSFCPLESQADGTLYNVVMTEVVRVA